MITQLFAYINFVVFLAVTIYQLRLMWERRNYRYQYSRWRRFLVGLAVMITGYFAGGYGIISTGLVDELFGVRNLRPWLWVTALAIAILARYVHRLTQVEEALGQIQESREDFERMKKHLLNAAGHELRTPLAGVMGYTELLTGGFFGVLTDGQMDAVQAAHDFSRRLHLLTERAIAVARPLDPTVFDLTDCIKEVLASKDIWINTRVRLEDREGWEMVFNRNTPLLISADPEKLTFVLVELVSNAIKFSNGGRRITIEATERGRNVIIAVTDQGIGIDEKFIATLGQWFTQLYAGSDHRYLGAGMGLAMVYELVQAHGGRIEIQSKVGEGSTFRVILPKEPGRP